MYGIVGSTFLGGTANYVMGGISIPAALLSLGTMCGSQLYENRHPPREARS
ncbi:MAG: hypothetical protein K1000chlam4_01102 [Chlamydiae bacterium]|nr:hypothetical protein [Chlamydiota bacterium]